MHSLKQIYSSRFYKLVEADIRKVRDLIQSQLTGRTNSVAELFQMFDGCSGKMIRPVLLLLAGRCFGEITNAHITAAAIIEMIHNATLLHDDVIDDGQKRRGLPTVNSIKGNETAVLMGDFLLSRASQLCAALEPHIYKKISDITAQVCEGELEQIAQKKNWQLSQQQYLDIITDKSASLFGGSCFLGADLAGADREEINALANFGLNAGIAFQIADDLTDIVGTEDDTGKTLGRDMDANKLTLPVIHLLTSVEAENRKNILDKLADFTNNKNDLLGILASRGSIDYVRGIIAEYISTAVNCLTPIKDCDAKEALHKIAGLIEESTA